MYPPAWAPRRGLRPGSRAARRPACSPWYRAIPADRSEAHPFRGPLLAAGPERVLLSARLSKSRAAPLRFCAGGVLRILAARPERALLSARPPTCRAAPLRFRAGGVWRSLAARFVRDEEAAGSNPATPTQVTGRI